MRRAPATAPAVAATRRGQVAYDPSTGVPANGARNIPEEKV